MLRFGVIAKAALPLMQARGGGTVVSISSLGAQRVMRDYFLVGVSKAALEAVTRYLAVEFAPLGVRVNAVAPGLVKTDLARALWEGREDAISAALPLRRVGEPEDIAEAVAFLAADEASWITGQTLVVDGGACSRPPVDV